MVSLSIYISDKIKILNDQLEKGLTNIDIDALEAAKLPLEQLHSHIRESIQASLREPASNLVRKLKRDEELSYDDIKTIERWLVGDAEYYTEIENNFQDWVNECKRLNNLLAGYTSPGFQEDEIKLFKLNAFLTDLEFTLRDVIRYAESLNRVKRFQSSIGSGRIEKDEKKWLADLIERQLAFEDF